VPDQQRDDESWPWPRCPEDTRCRPRVRDRVFSAKHAGGRSRNQSGRRLTRALGRASRTGARRRTPTRLPSGAVTVAAPRLDVVVVNWNTGTYLRECLGAVAVASRSAFELGQVVVVDNASSDDSVADLSGLPLPLRILRNAENRGFAAASNQGAAASDGDFILFLNPDTRVSPEALERTVAFMTDPANAAIGICGGRMVGETGVEEFSCARFPTLWMVVAKMFGLTHVIPQWVPRQRLESAELHGSGIVDQVIGAYFLIRRPLFELLDGFDERFFVYMEDVDLAYRSRQLGHPSFFLADVTVRHMGQVSSDQVKGRRLFYLLRGRTQYAYKHWPRWQPPLLVLLTISVELPARWLVAASRGQQDELKAVREAAIRYVRYAASLGLRG
jgi:N-acetylglucosaminyl-diphospho-decaprenol L-rhamnosyltransferase